jgi:hypothetical protein
MGNGRRGDKAVGGIAMQAFKFTREQRHVPCEGKFKNAVSSSSALSWAGGQLSL